MGFIGHVLTIAAAEFRLTRRLVRFWVFFVLTLLMAAISYGQLAGIHWAFSGGSASAAGANPRFFVTNVGSNILLPFLAGAIFLAFDVRARDRKERMMEVLDSLPYSNLQLLLGRAMGTVGSVWMAAALSIGMVWGVSFLIGNPLEPVSVLRFLLLMVIPALTFVCGLVYLAVLGLRHRGLAALVALVAIATVFVVGVWFIPISQVAFSDLTGFLSLPWASDLTGGFVDVYGGVQRIAILLVGLGFIWLAATIHPRPDDGSKPVRAGVGAALLIGGILGLAGLAAGETGAIADREAWLAAHEARAEEPAPDMVALGGLVTVGSSTLDLDLDLRFKAPLDRELSKALFTLNPGLEVTSVNDASGGSLGYSHEDGLLEIELPRTLAAGESMEIGLEADGSIEDEFAYLTAAIEMREMPAINANMLILGYEPTIHESDYVAMMPGAHWLPSSGAINKRKAALNRDFYIADLTVDVRDDWLVAGPGRRLDADGAGSGRARYRFATDAPLPQVAMVAGPFEERAVEVQGVQLSLLLDETHASRFELFEDAGEEITEWLTTKMQEADELGLPYPYDGLTMVEVPGVLRGWGDGWRMDSTLIQPAMILLREHSLPTANFNRLLGMESQWKEREGGLPRYKRDLLETFFQNDMNGGNPFVATARSFFGFQTAGEGAAATALDYVLEDLATRVVTESQGYFSVHFFDQRVGEKFINAGTQMNNPDRVNESYADLLIQQVTSKPEIWNAVLEASLVDLDPWEDPNRALDALNLKGRAMGQSLLDGMGREKAGQLLAAVREDNRGDTFDMEDVAGAGEAVGEDLRDWLSVWLEQTALPGFTVSKSELFRLEDGEDGTPRYQTRITIRNDEDAPGLLRVDYRVGEGRDRADLGKTDPIEIDGRSAVEIGMVTSKAPRWVRVLPYLSLNRDPFEVALPPLDDEELVEGEPFDGIQAADWTEIEDATIVVDDLDAGFTIETVADNSIRVSGSGSSDEGTDQGLPVKQFNRPAARWSRDTEVSAFGRYRHTHAMKKKGKGKELAVFTSEVPKDGPWELQYHLPKMRNKKRLGTWKLTVEDSSGERELEFEASQGRDGWNSLGIHEIASGEVRVVVSDETEGRVVIADAIRWVPQSGAGEKDRT